MLLAWVPKRAKARERTRKNAKWHDWFLTSPDKKEEKNTGLYQGKCCYLPKYIRISNINQHVPFKRHFLIAEESHSCWQLIYKYRNVVFWTIASLELTKCRNKWCSSVCFFNSFASNFFLSTFRRLMRGSYLKLAGIHGHTANHCRAALSGLISLSEQGKSVCSFWEVTVVSAQRLTISLRHSSC